MDVPGGATELVHTLCGYLGTGRYDGGGTGHRAHTTGAGAEQVGDHRQQPSQSLHSPSVRGLGGSRRGPHQHGRAWPVLDNFFTERLWHNVKYEEVYLHDYETPREARIGITHYMAFYNHERFHPSLGHRTPAEVYADGEVAVAAGDGTSDHAVASVPGSMVQIGISRYHP